MGGIFDFLYELKKVKNGVNRNPTHLSKNAANRSNNSIVLRYFDVNFKYTQIYLYWYKFVLAHTANTHVDLILV